MYTSFTLLRQLSGSQTRTHTHTHVSVCEPTGARRWPSNCCHQGAPHCGLQGDPQVHGFPPRLTTDPHGHTPQRAPHPPERGALPCGVGHVEDSGQEGREEASMLGRTQSPTDSPYFSGTLSVRHPPHSGTRKTPTGRPRSPAPERARDRPKSGRRKGRSRTVGACVCVATTQQGLAAPPRTCYPHTRPSPSNPYD